MPKLLLQLGMAATACSLAGTVQAQSSLPAPTDTDLRAAYCARAEKLLLDGLDSSGIMAVVQNMQANPSTADKAKVVTAQIGEIKADAARYSAYATMRLTYVDPTMMVLAMNSASADMEAVTKAAAAGNPSAAMEESARVSRCRDSSWLPF